MEQKLPRGLLTALHKIGLQREQIMRILYCDMTCDCAYLDSYLLLCADKLYHAVALAAPREKLFAGFSPAESTDSTDYRVQAYDLCEITQLRADGRVVGGYIYAVTQDGALPLAAYSGAITGNANHFCDDFARVQAGETLPPQPHDDKEDCCPKCGNLYPDPRRKICPKCMDRKGVFVRLLAYFKPHTLKIVVMMLCFIATAVLNLAWPYLSGTVLYDMVLGGTAAANEPAFRFTLTLGSVVATMVISKLLMQAAGIVHSVITARIVPDVIKSVRSDIFAAMGRLSISFYSSRQTGGLMTRVLSDSDQVMAFFFDEAPYFFTNIFTIVSTVIVMFSMSWKLAIVSLILLPLLPIISTKLTPRLWHLYGKRHRASRSLSGQINDNITGARVVKAFGQEAREIERFSTYNARVRTAEMNIVGYDNRFHALYSIVQNLAQFAVWGFGSMMILSGEHIELGVLITFASYVTQLNGPLDFMARVFRRYADCTNSAQRVFEIIDAIPEVTEAENPVRVDRIRGEIRLEQVTFGYEPHHDVLKNINLHIREGEMLGIVGRSGAGKSTLVNLINRLYDPKEGNIYIDGHNIRDMAFADFRSSVAMVSQETYIFMGSVEQNIAYARPDATHAEVVAAAIAASAHDFICKMPDGYDTIIGSSGRSLSGGERQRISIARAILANPKILILDEATAAVDTETELAIQDSLDLLTKGRTTISIAHRLSTLRNADRLVVIDDGRITEEGTHAELIRQKGTYFKLMQLQSKALAMRGIE